MSEKQIKPSSSSRSVQNKSSTGDIAAFLKVAGTTNPAGSGKLIFALDATMSRQPTWDKAMMLQASMFDSVGSVKSGDSDKAGATALSVQLLYFRGFGECRASKWVVNSAALRDLMTGIECRGGQTQIGKVLAHALKEQGKAKLDAMVFIGDAMEENIDLLCQRAGQLGMKGTRCFFFQEGHNALTEKAFREMAKLTRGAYFRLGPDSARELAELLSAIAVYARGGLTALQTSSKANERRLLQQIK